MDIWLEVIVVASWLAHLCHLELISSLSLDYLLTSHHAERWWALISMMVGIN